MERIAESEVVRRQWMRLVALLLGLAALADRACGAPLPVRTRAMSFLLPAESIAREFVAGEAGLPALSPAHPDDEDADAERLAARFRALAFFLVGAAARLWGNCRVREEIHRRTLRVAAETNALNAVARVAFRNLGGTPGVRVQRRRSMPYSTGSGLSNPDDELVSEQQRRDLRHAGRSQPDQAKQGEKPTSHERLDRDTRANEGIGSALAGGQPSSETEEALARAVERSRRE